MWEKNKKITICDKRTIICDVGIAQCENETIKCDKKIRETTKCDKSTIKCDVGTTQCGNETVKCEKKKKKKKKGNHQMWGWNHFWKSFLLEDLIKRIKCPFYKISSWKSD